MSDHFDTLTFNLFSRPSFLEGMGRIFDFSHSYHFYNYSKSVKEADLKALHSDWIMVGRDIKLSIDKHEQEEKSESHCG